MTEEMLIYPTTFRATQMLQNNHEIEKKEDNTLLSSLALEVDDIFFSLRKADQIIRRELHFLSNQKNKTSKLARIAPIDDKKLKTIIAQLPPYQILVDEYIVYMLENPSHSLFKLIEQYNEAIEKRKIELEKKSTNELINIDERLVHYIRQLGAMVYHLNIHLNLLNVLLKNASLVAETQQISIRESQEVVTEYMVNQWGEKQQNVRFLEVTIDSSYAIITWTVEDLRGDAILQNHEGYWQLINISAGMFGLRDFENVAVPLEVAQRMLRLHHQKLGY